MRRRSWIALAVWWLPAVAVAGNDDEIFVGNDAAMMGGAVTALVRDGSAVWYNPAGLAGVDVDTLNVSASAFALRWHDAPSLLSADSGEVAGANFLEFVSAPSALTYVRPLSDTVRGGFGVFVTRASDISIDALLDLEQTSPRVPASARVLLALEFAETSYHLGPSIGWRIQDNLWFGASLLGTLQQINFSSLYTGGSSDQSPDAVALFNQSDRLELTLFGVLVNAGLQWQMTDALRLGLTVQSPTYEVWSTVSQPIVRTGLATTPEGTVYGFFADRLGGSRLGFRTFEPARVRLGLAYTAGDWLVSVDGDLRPRLSGARSFRWNLRAGARYTVSDAFEVGAGLFTDRSAAPTLDGFGARDIDFYGGTLGGTYLTALRLAKDRDAVTFATTLGLRYAYGRGTVGGLVVPTEGDDLLVVQSTPGRLTTHEVGVHLGSAVRF